MLTTVVTTIVTIILSIIMGLEFGTKVGLTSLLCIPLIIKALFLLESYVGFQGILFLAVPFLIFGVKDCLAD